jgi:hypothetical protein
LRIFDRFCPPVINDTYRPTVFGAKNRLPILIPKPGACPL